MAVRFSGPTLDLDCILEDQDDSEGCGEDADGRPGRVKTLVPQWKTVFTAIVLILAVIIIDSLPNTAQQGKAGVVIATTALLWCTEAMPLMITALVPAILFPFAGVMTAKTVAAQYFNDVNMLMLGTFLIAEAVESSGLHKRIALGILSLLGRSEALLMLGSMLVTWKLSMFMSNTATTAMMLPIIAAVIESLKTIQRELEKRTNVLELKTNGAVTEPLPATTLEEGEESEEEEEEEDPTFNWFCKGLILSIPYGASIGGIATLTGTPPNLVFKAAFEQAFPDAPGVDYGTWMGFAYPISLMVVLAGWHILVIMYARRSYVEMILNLFRWIWKKVFPDANVGEESADTRKWREVNLQIRKRYRALGPFRFPEIALMCLVGILVILWLFRNPAGMKGWAVHHADKAWPDPDTHWKKLYLTDAWICLVIGILLFNVPKDNPLEGTLLWRAPPGKKFKRSKKLLDMEIVMRRTPWDVLFLLGGGYAIAYGCETSGLSTWLGESFSFLEGQNTVLIAFVISLMVAMLTEVASNTASTTLLMPILASMSRTLGLNPLYLMICGTISASLAFCLPSATAPNALVFSFKQIGVVDMLRTGVFMNITSICLVVLGVSTWTKSILGIDLHTLPDWANNIQIVPPS